jgi:hypothetical protein
MSDYNAPEDYMMLGPGMGPTYEWKDFPLENGTSKFTDEVTRLNNLGADGWELVIVEHEHKGRQFIDTYYLKKAVD